MIEDRNKRPVMEENRQRLSIEEKNQGPVADKVNLRALALDALMEINEGGEYSHYVLRALLGKYRELEKNRRSFLQRLVEGTLERQIELDHIINSYSSVRVEKQKPLIRNLLRMGVYQLKYMDGVPDSAVCNEAVKLARRRGFAKLSGFVNGVLRKIAREGCRVSLPDAKAHRAEYLGIRYSMPLWIVEQWLGQYGEEHTGRMLHSLLEEHPLVIRANLLKTTPGELQRRLKEEGLQAKPLREPPYAFELRGVDTLDALGSFRDGWFYVQDIGSMLVAEWALAGWMDSQGIKSLDSLQQALYVIDVCAAPGGKSTHLAELLGEHGFVEARDLTEYKAGLLRENIASHGLSNMEAVVMDATVHDAASVGQADILICDLPCSGLGVMGKKTDIRYKMSPEKQGQLAALQRQMLDTVHDYVKEGGVLIYSTCTLSSVENEDNISWFLRKYPDFLCVRQRQLLPGEDSYDGFFLAEMIRKRN